MALGRIIDSRPWFVGHLEENDGRGDLRGCGRLRGMCLQFGPCGDWPGSACCVVAMVWKCIDRCCI